VCASTLILIPDMRKRGIYYQKSNAPVWWHIVLYVEVVGVFASDAFASKFCTNMSVLYFWHLAGLRLNMIISDVFYAGQ